MKKKYLFSVIALILLSSGLVEGQQNKTGLGFMLGRPTGIAGNYWFSETNSIDFGLGYSLLSSNSSVSLHADYLYHRRGVINRSRRIDAYYGVGGRFKAEKHEKGSLGVRGVMGLRTEFNTIPVDLFFEIAPVFKLFPKTAVGLDIALGGRYYFD